MTAPLRLFEEPTVTKASIIREPAVGGTPWLVLAIGVGLIVSLLSAAVVDHRLAAIESAVSSLGGKLAELEAGR